MKKLALVIICISIFTAGFSQNSQDGETGRKTHERLHGVLWMQTSPEYQMACHQSFLLGLQSIKKGINDRSWTASTEQMGQNYWSLDTLAIIVDVDETILDNSPFQARLVDQGIDYDHDQWKEWVDEKKARPVPGAKEFIHEVGKLGVEVYYVTNREKKEATLKNLRDSIDSEIRADRVLCKNEKEEWSSDKTSRRALIAQSRRILLLVGDDYNDFVYLGNKPGPEERVVNAGSYQSYWGSRWILLPNPLYGSFEKATYKYDYDFSDMEKLKFKYQLIKTEE